MSAGAEAGVVEFHNLQASGTLVYLLIRRSMVVIRDQQMKTLEGFASKTFEDRVFAHLVRTWPERCSALGEAEVRASIRKGIDLAAGYGITSQSDVAGYIDLMYVHGWDFDRDPAMLWAASILQDQDLQPHTKMQRLYERTEQELAVSPQPA